MEKKQQTIICFTSSYPYGTRETYFENELQYLAQEFKTVYIQPTYNPFKTHAKRNIPANVVVLDQPLVPAGKLARISQGIFNFSSMNMFIKDFFKNKAYGSKPAVMQWLNALMVHRISYKRMKNLLQNFDKSTVLYSYWASAPVFATKLCKPYKKIVRMHFGDFYLERFNGYMPVRSDIYRSADLLIPISDNISAILEKHYQINKRKIYVNHLGIDNNCDYSTISDNNTIRIVSCSHLEPRKRIHLIAEALLKWKSDRKIEWHHFGAGPELEKIQGIIQKVNSNVTVHLHGAVSQADLYSFYQHNYVHWFVNVSTGEGIPVSIMEAFSFGIPAIATNGGATSEIVNMTNGYLIPKEFEADYLAELLCKVDDNYTLKRTKAYNTWQGKFRAKANYSNMVQKINTFFM